jgi:hypothetical protein
MLRVGFEPTTPVFERAKIFHALDRADTVIGKTDTYLGFLWFTSDTDTVYKADHDSFIIYSIRCCNQRRAKNRNPRINQPTMPVP